MCEMGLSITHEAQNLVGPWLGPEPTHIHLFLLLYLTFSPGAQNSRGLSLDSPKMLHYPTQSYL